MIKKITILFFLFISITIKGQQERYTIKNLDLNKEYSEFGTTFYGDDKVVFAAPRKKSFIIRNVWKGNNQPFLDLYIGDIKDEGQLANVTTFSDRLNTRFHEADVAFTKDKKTVYFSRNNYFEGKLKKDSTGVGLIQLFRAKINNEGQWVNVEPMPFNNDEYQTGHPTLSADEKTLYFISDMPGGFGKTDVYKAEIYEDGTIGTPINLGPTINTSGKEMFASISGNDELYFSSDGREDGLGGLDIYVSKITSEYITEPQNLGEPINSIKDDFSFIINYETRRGYFSSNRSGGKGDDDIYTFIQNIPLEFECNQYVKGTVINKNTGVSLSDVFVVLYDNEGNEQGRMLSDAEGKFNFEIHCNETYKLEANKEGYSTDEKEFFSTEGKELEVSLAISSEEFVVERGKCKVKINPIYFDFDKANIRPDAALELDKVVAVMNKYPELIIEGGSHTDSRGTFNYNKSLSTRRAKSTVAYIISKGINPTRISAKGYGESQLVNGCKDGINCLDEEHAYNRRTEFVIVNYNDIKDKYPEICATSTMSALEEIELEKKTPVKQDRNKVINDNEFITVRNLTLININPIFFELNSSYLNEYAELELNRVLEIMMSHPEIKVEVGSHTDSRASEKYNLWLSERRAKRIENYLLSRGITSTRISSKGYGESRLINDCINGVRCSESQHQQNRRTEFVILNPEVINRN